MLMATTVARLARGVAGAVTAATRHSTEGKDERLCFARQYCDCETTYCTQSYFKPESELTDKPCASSNASFKRPIRSELSAPPKEDGPRANANFPVFHSTPLGSATARLAVKTRSTAFSLDSVSKPGPTGHSEVTKRM
jgi:hypothetical protein